MSFLSRLSLALLATIVGVSLLTVAVSGKTRFVESASNLLSAAP